VLDRVDQVVRIYRQPILTVVGSSTDCTRLGGAGSEHHGGRLAAET